MGEVHTRTTLVHIPLLSWVQIHCSLSPLADHNVWALPEIFKSEGLTNCRFLEWDYEGTDVRWGVMPMDSGR